MNIFLPVNQKRDQKIRVGIEQTDPGDAVDPILINESDIVRFLVRLGILILCRTQ